MSAGRTTALAALATALLVAAGCGGDAPPSGDARKGGAVVVAEPVPPNSLDPALAENPPAVRTAWLAYTPLLTYGRAGGAEGTELIPALARELPEASEDGRTYTLTLRRGLRYSDGRPLRASDFERGLARSLRLNPRAERLFGGVVGASAYARSDGDDGDIPGVEVDDEAGTIRVELDAPDRLFPYALAAVLAAPVPRGTPQRELSEDPPPGIGPYRVSQVRRNGDIVLERRAEWRLPGIPAGNPHEIVTRTVADPARSVRAVNSGRVDIVEGEAPQRLLPEIRSDGERYREHLTLRSLRVAIDASRAPFRDPDARRALGYALDVSVLSRLHDGFLEPSCNMLPPAVAGYRELDPCPFGERLGNADLVEASRLVREASATGADVAVADGDDRRGRALARYLWRTLRKIGLDARLTSGPHAQVGFAVADPALPHPSRYLDELDDPLLHARVTLLAQEGDPRERESEWAAVDEEIVSRALSAPYGVETAGVLGSRRLDMENCARFHPLYGLDYSSLCLL